MPSRLNRELAKKLQEALASRTMRVMELAERAGLERNSIYRALRGESVSVKSLGRIARALKEDPKDWVRAGKPDLVKAVMETPERIAGASEIYIPAPSEAALPVAGVLRGGTIVHAEELREEVFPCLPEHAALADYVVRIEGDSLYPLILPGDYVAVRKTSTARNGDIVVARVGDKAEETVVKKYSGRRAGAIILESVNPLYPPIIAAKAEIVGLVVWQHRSLESLRKYPR